jgi:hypothetical protein
MRGTRKHDRGTYRLLGADADGNSVLLAEGSTIRAVTERWSWVLANTTTNVVSFAHSTDLREKGLQIKRNSAYLRTYIANIGPSCCDASREDHDFLLFLGGASLSPRGRP